MSGLQEKENEQQSAMDPEIWGHLQDNIGLAEMIFGKLPFHEFKLRSVCKDWNRLACDRQFVVDTFKKLLADDMPYFILPSFKDDPPAAQKFLNGILLYDETFNRWRWIRPGEALSGGSLVALLWYRCAR